MLKFPYGISDFYQLITEQYFYVDRTAKLRLIEEAGKQLLFLRPRRFGKSLVLSMLENYYDVAKAGEFEQLFGHLAIGQNPTPKHNQYFVLKWDFANVSPEGDVRDIRQTLHRYLNTCLADFATYYQHLLPKPIQVEPVDAQASFQSLLSAVKQTPYRLYLLIDEYDSFANELMMGTTSHNPSRYQALLSGEGALKALFKAVKSASSGGGLERVFITGVSPVMLTDLTSSYNVAKNIYLKPQFADLCGFSEAELQQVLSAVAKECGFSDPQTQDALSLMRTFYNGYRFSESLTPVVYNPTLALYFLEIFQETCQAPNQMLDNNFAMDRSKLAYLTTLPQGAPLIMAALAQDPPVSLPQLEDRFGVAAMLNASLHNTKFLASLLYYLGVLTLAGRNAFGELQLVIPNLVVRKLYVERLQELFLPETATQDAVATAVQRFYQTGEFQPVCDFVEQRLFSVFDNRDYPPANELTVKTLFLTLLFNDTFYIMDSETALERRYADLTMIVRPTMRQYQLLDILIEFKYVKLEEVKRAGKEVKVMTADDLKKLPAVQLQLGKAVSQLQDYRQRLQRAYQGQLRLRVYAVVAVGFERLVWEEV
jgi:Predicted AAA-ATPase/PD-(D/E)XK nuclease superfamily